MFLHIATQCTSFDRRSSIEGSGRGRSAAEKESAGGRENAGRGCVESTETGCVMFVVAGGRVPVAARRRGPRTALSALRERSGSPTRLVEAHPRAARQSTSGRRQAKSRARATSTSTASLFNKRITPISIGHSDITCIDTGTGSSNCTGTYFLPKGKIMVEGVIASRLFYELAVIGGTGLYDNVRGTLTVTYLGGSAGAGVPPLPARDLSRWRARRS